MATSPVAATATAPRGRGASVMSFNAHTKSQHITCPHLGSKTKAIVDRLKVLVPYANVCRHRQALLQGRRGALTNANIGLADNREATPAASTSASGEGDRSRKRLVDEMPPPTCFTCNTPVDRLHACLECDEFGCWRRGSGSHIVKHLRTANHSFAIDFVRLELYCRECGDYIYDQAVTGWLRGAYMRWYAALCDSAEPEAKRPRIVAPGSDLSPAQSKYLRDHGAVRVCGGIRGLANLGATCYLSVVMQALLHNPLMRGWMLSDGHHQSKCRIGRTAWLNSNAPGTTGALPPPPPPPQSSSSETARGCMACELETAFQAVYDAPRATGPFGPVGMLRTLWLLRNDLAGYGQQDAHECLMAVLDTLHSAFTENVLAPSELEHGANSEMPDPVAHTLAHPCACLVHQAFAGVLQSTVTCSRCGNTTNAHDPMLDISLDIAGCGTAPPRRESSGGRTPTLPVISTTYRLAPAPASFGARMVDAALSEWAEQKASSRASNNKRPSVSARTSPSHGSFPVVTLQECLAQFTRVESLPTGAYACSHCRTDSGAATKQLSVKELPPILAFQLKRFERTAKAQSAKIDTFVRLPLRLDMTPYTAASMAAHTMAISGLRASNGNTITNTGNSLADTPSLGGVPIHDLANGSASNISVAEMPKDTPVPVIDGPGGSTTLGKRRTDATHSNPACQYSLFAVIDHIGHLDTGHYTAYAQHRGQWYLFDDATVTRAEIKDVLGFADELRVRQGRSAKGKAYMAFYVKTVLDYHDGAPAASAANAGGQQPAADRLATASIGTTNTHINESGEWIEDAGVVRTRINPSGDVKAERRGRKKGSHAPKRATSKDPTSSDAKRRRGRPPAASKDSLPLQKRVAAAAAAGHEDGELEDGEFLAHGNVKMAVVSAGRVSDTSDSDGEALWARMSKGKARDELVPMVQEIAPRAGEAVGAGMLQVDAGGAEESLREQLNFDYGSDFSL